MVNTPSFSPATKANLRFYKQATPRKKSPRNAAPVALAGHSEGSALGQQLVEQPHCRVGDVGPPHTVTVGRQMLAVKGRPLAGLREPQRVDIAARMDILRQVGGELL